MFLYISIIANITKHFINEAQEARVPPKAFCLSFFFFQVKKEVGDVTILINNAGILIGKKFCDLTDEDFEKTFRINFFSQVWVKFL